MTRGLVYRWGVKKNIIIIKKKRKKERNDDIYLSAWKKASKRNSILLINHAGHVRARVQILSNNPFEFPRIHMVVLIIMPRGCPCLQPFLTLGTRQANLYPLYSRGWRGGKRKTSHHRLTILSVLSNSPIIIIIVTNNSVSSS